MNEEKKVLVLQRINKAKDALKDVKILVENKRWNIAANRLYYACFYAVSGLLVAHDYETKTHSGTQQFFGLHFVKTGLINRELGKYYTDILSMRQSADYEYDVEYEAEDVLPLVEPAHNFITEIENFLSKE